MSIPPETEPPQSQAEITALAHLARISKLNCPFMEECGVAQGILDGTITAVDTCQGESPNPYWQFRCLYDVLS